MSRQRRRPSSWCSPSSRRQGACGAGWRRRSTVVVAPILDGEPATTSVVYNPPMLVLTLMLATVAGMLAVDGVARLRRQGLADALDARLH